MVNEDDMNILSRFVNRHGLWRGTAWGISAIALLQGSIYSVKGDRVATGPSFSVLKDQFPDGVKVYGYAMLLVACAAMYSSAVDNTTTSRKIMLGIFIFSVWMNVIVIAGWIHAHSAGINGLSIWFLVLWLSLWLSATVGPSGGRDAS